MRALRGGRDRELHAGKVLDLLAYDGNSSLVRGVKFKNTSAVEVRSVEFFGEGKNGGCFACAGRAVEEHVWEL